MQFALTHLALVCVSLCALPQRQTPPAVAQCPTIYVDCPSAISQPGAPVKFTAMVIGAPPEGVGFIWAVSTGTIISGQGTPTIQVAYKNPQSLTATVTVTGLPTSCTNNASCSLIVYPAPPSRLFAHYGRLSLAAEQKQLDLFADELATYPGAQGYIIISPGRRDAGRTAGQHANRARSRLLNLRGIDAGRIVLVNGQPRKQLLVELYVVPVGATPPSRTSQ